MNTVFSLNQYVLKRQGLAIAGKYQLFSAQGDEPLLYIEEKTKLILPSQTYRVWADEKKAREAFTLKLSDNEGIEINIRDAESGQKICGIGVAADDLDEFVKNTMWRGLRC